MSTLRPKEKWSWKRLGVRVVPTDRTDATAGRSAPMERRQMQRPQPHLRRDPSSPVEGKSRALGVVSDLPLSPRGLPEVAISAHQTQGTAGGWDRDLTCSLVLPAACNPVPTARASQAQLHCRLQPSCPSLPRSRLPRTWTSGNNGHS